MLITLYLDLKKAMGPSHIAWELPPLLVEMYNYNSGTALSV